MGGAPGFAGQTVITRVKPAPDLPPTQLDRLNDSLYKFMRPEHAQGLLEQGAVRVGTLWEYQNEELHGNQVGDSGEGRKAAFDDRQLVLSDDPSTVSPIMKEVINFEGSSGIVIQGITTAVEEVTEDLYVYSTAAHFDRASFAEFANKGYTSCVRITDPAGFVRELDTAMQKLHNARTCTVLPCVYGARVAHYKNAAGAHPVQLKPKRLAHQSEVRIIWRSDKQPLEPQIFAWPALRRFCVIHASI